MIKRRRRAFLLLSAMASLVACGEPMFENAGSQKSLLEDWEACAMEMEQSPAAVAYRQNPTATPEYVSQVFEETNNCIEKKGWRQVKSQPSSEQVHEAIVSELTHRTEPVTLSDPKARETFVRAIEDRLSRPSSAAQSSARKE